MVFIALILSLSGLLFALHFLRVRVLRGPFVMYLTFLWFLSWLTGTMGYRLEVDIVSGFQLQVRYSSAIYTLIFVGLLLVYICEGTVESRDMILISLGSQVLIALAQIFFYFAKPFTRSPELSKLLFEPSFYRMAVSIFAATFDLFFAVSSFQFLVNRTGGRTFLPLVISLTITMALDSLIFVGATRTDQFLQAIPSHLIFKTIVVSVLAVPMYAYVRYFRKTGHLDLKRGSLDIFRRIKGLEEDLEAANQGLRNYAANLEKMVEDRTRIIQQKQDLLDLEMEMATEVQKAMLPHASKLGELNFEVRFLPCTAVSGDMYDFGRLQDGRLFLFVADISGHGVPSALVGSMCKMSLSRIDLRNTSPAGVLTAMSETIQPVSSSHYLTAFFAVISLETREIAFSNGAHPPPLLIAGAKALDLEPTGSILGTELESPYSQKRVKYPPASRLVLYTDCATEHRNSNKDEFSPERFRDLMIQNRTKSPSEAADIFIHELKEFGEGKPLTDDLTLIILDLP